MRKYIALFSGIIAIIILITALYKLYPGKELKTAYDVIDSTIWGQIAELEYRNGSGETISFSDAEKINLYKDILHKTKIKDSNRYEQYTGGSNCWIVLDNGNRYCISYEGNYIVINGKKYIAYMDKDTARCFQMLFVNPLVQKNKL